MNKLGVIIPVFNNANYLTKCIESVIQQKSIDMCVIVDDGSTDDSGNIADKFALENEDIKVIHQTNQGVMAAIKRGVKEIDSEYITIVDSDDWVEHETYCSMMIYMEQNVDIIDFPMSRFLSDTSRYVEAGGRKNGVYNKKKIREEIFDTMIWDNKVGGHGLNPSLCNKIFKKDLFKKYVEIAPTLIGNYGQDMVILYPMLDECNSIVFSEYGRYIHRIKCQEIAPYIASKGFYRNLLEIYDYLSKCFKNNPVIVKQLDFHFAETARLHIKIYNSDCKKIVYFLFPFHLFPQGSRIVLYGAGVVGKEYHMQIEATGYCQIVAWVDQRKNVSCDSYQIYSPEDINKFKFDFVVIAVNDENMANEIKTRVEDLQVELDRIIWCITSVY